MTAMDKVVVWTTFAFGIETSDTGFESPPYSTVTFDGCPVTMAFVTLDPDATPLVMGTFTSGRDLGANVVRHSHGVLTCITRL